MEKDKEMELLKSKMSHLEKELNKLKRMIRGKERITRATSIIAQLEYEKDDYPK